MEHPMVTMINKTGYSADMQEKSCGSDLFGNEVLVGDEIVILPNGEMLLEDSLEDYLIEKLGFEFKTAE